MHSGVIQFYLFKFIKNSKALVKIVKFLNVPVLAMTIISKK